MGENLQLILVSGSLGACVDGFMCRCVRPSVACGAVNTEWFPPSVERVAGATRLASA